MREQGQLDVLLLGGLVAAGQKDNEFPIPFRVGHAVARPEIDLQLGHAVGEAAMLPGGSADQPIHTHLDAGATRTILESIDPVSIDLGSLNLHAYSVSHMLQDGNIGSGDGRYTRGVMHGAAHPPAQWLNEAPRLHDDGRFFRLRECVATTRGCARGIGASDAIS